jgi:hypothetical protein
MRWKCFFRSLIEQHYESLDNDAEKIVNIDVSIGQIVSCQISTEPC